MRDFSAHKALFSRIISILTSVAILLSDTTATHQKQRISQEHKYLYWRYLQLYWNFNSAISTLIWYNNIRPG